MNDKRGSKWRKWDLHVHTPASLVQNFKHKENEDIWETYIKDLENLPAEFQVLGINDYIFIDGYKKVLEYKAKGRLQNIQLILPVIEFRIRKFAGHKQFKRINLHVVFSDEVSADTIQAQFLNGLSAKYKLTTGLNSTISWGGMITPESLSDLGKTIKASVPAEELKHFGTDLEEGFSNLNCDEDEIISFLENSTYFKGKYLLAIGKTEWDALSWNDNSVAEKKDVISKCDLVFTSAESIEAYNKAKEKLKEQNVNDLLLDCSDAHQNSDSTTKDRIGKCFTWIKADPSFEGLRQIIHERDRIFIGEIPPLLIRINGTPTKFIDKLEIKKKQNSSLSESWFDGLNISLNGGLVAIIGNKGNGKSAIADIIGLCGNTHNADNFSFLNSDKFKKKKPTNKAQEFEATITWRNGTTDLKLLSDDVDKNLTEKVKYIPQNFLETLCSVEDGDDFEKELRKIIFSHTPQSERIGANSLDELIKNKSEVIELDINIIKNEIVILNVKISDIEARRNPDYRKTIQDSYEQKKVELEAHEKIKPTAVPPPGNNDSQQAINKQIHELREKIDNLEKIILQKNQEKLELNVSINELTKANQALVSVSSQLNVFIEGQKPIYEKYQIDPLIVFTHQINAEPITTKLKEKQTQLDAINILLNPSETSLSSQILSLQTQINSLKEQLDAPSKKHQQYLSALKIWESTKANIIGDKLTEGSLTYFVEVLRYVDNDLPKEFETAKETRKKLVESLYEKKNEIIDLYRVLFKPVTDFIGMDQHLTDNYQIKLDVSFQLNGFMEKFFDHISVGAKGSFIGKEEGYKRLQQIIEVADLNTKEGFVLFIQEVVSNIFRDKRPDQKDEPRSLRDQLKKGYAPVDFYSFLFSLDYLTPAYRLKLGDKDLSELSPGERGALLLIFYLLLDNDDIPLIIDQPEENLDNQSVYTILVKFIKQVKDQRQIIIVTHNPNLAVVCDAEQIIHIKIAKEDGNKVSYLTGAIENPDINKSVVEILEGTFPAFDNRTEKYRVTKR
ncbi:MAG: AAA family ATPase [Bacteroidota bacterium]|nr:AAA family ATPase [Bacteroidota bacterium]